MEVFRVKVRCQIALAVNVRLHLLVYVTMQCMPVNYPCAIDMTPENISGDFRHKSTSMQGLNEISRENSPRCELNHLC